MGLGDLHTPGAYQVLFATESCLCGNEKLDSKEFVHIEHCHSFDLEEGVAIQGDHVGTLLLFAIGCFVSKIEL